LTPTKSVPSSGMLNRRGRIRVVDDLANCGHHAGYISRTISGHSRMKAFPVTAADALIVEIPARNVSSESCWSMKVLNSDQADAKYPYLGMLMLNPAKSGWCLVECSKLEAPTAAKRGQELARSNDDGLAATKVWSSHTMQEGVEELCVSWTEGDGTISRVEPMLDEVDASNNDLWLRKKVDLVKKKQVKLVFEAI